MITSITKLDYSGCKVIIASSSVGNVSQFAMDLLITNLKAQHVGMIWHDAVLALVGSDPIDSSKNGMCTSTEVYFSPQNKLLLIQMRSPLCSTKKRQTNFLEEIIQYVKSLGAESFIILGGLFAQSRTDSELSTAPFRYITCPKSEKLYGSSFEGLSWLRMKGNESEVNHTCPILVGAGFSRPLFKKCVQEGLPCSILLYFCSEGDNIPDGINFCKIINEWLDVLPEKGNNLVHPASWKFLFGNDIPMEIY